MITYEKAKRIIKENITQKDLVLTLSLETDTKFIFVFGENTKHEEIDDCSFFVDKNSSKIGEYAPLLHINEFRNALKNGVIYKKRK